MGTHIRELHEGTGDLIDVFYFCSRGCWRDSFDVARLGIADAREPTIELRLAGMCGGLTEGGAAPCAASEAASDREVFCAECGVLMASPWRDTPVVVNLIERPPISPVTGAAEPVDALSSDELERCQCGALAIEHEQPFLTCPNE